jgi:hypothetical protein
MPEPAEFQALAIFAMRAETLFVGAASELAMSKATIFEGRHAA